jgi:hypothetical protein
MVRTTLLVKTSRHNLKANDPAYLKIQEEDLLEEYQKGIDNLTIDPANWLQRTVEVLKIEKSRIAR